MVTAIEIETVKRAIRTRLLGDATLNNAPLALNKRIYLDLAPTGSVWPIVTISGMSAIDLMTQNRRHVWQEVNVLVKVTEQFTGVDMNYTLKLIPMAQRVMELLDGYSVVMEGIYVIKLARTNMPPQAPDVVSGVKYAHINQIFMTEAYPV